MPKNTFVERVNERFIDFADLISAFMGTPANILFWLLVVLAWFVAFATHPDLQNSTFLPSWFTSNSFNFPLNSITTLAELYIGFLIAAAANRVERRNDALLEKIERQEEQIAGQEEKILLVLAHLETLIGTQVL